MHVKEKNVTCNTHSNQNSMHWETKYEIVLYYENLMLTTTIVVKYFIII